MSEQLKKHAGGCHCGAVRFEVEADLTKGVGRCNCSICLKLGGTTTIVKPDAFKLLKGESETSIYEWGGRTGKRYFCKHCGVSCFLRGYLEQIGGDYVSVFVNAFDDVELIGLSIQHWDGRHNNWMAGPRPEPWPVAGGLPPLAPTPAK
jgi:hypothetical protein